MGARLTEDERRIADAVRYARRADWLGCTPGNAKLLNELSIPMDVPFRELKAILEERGVSLNRTEQYEAFRYRKHALILDAAKQNYSSEQLSALEYRASEEDKADEIAEKIQEWGCFDLSWVQCQIVDQHWQAQSLQQGEPENDQEGLIKVLADIAKSVNLLNLLIVQGYTRS
jgi:hypothetical protein